MALTFLQSPKFLLNFHTFLIPLSHLYANIIVKRMIGSFLILPEKEIMKYNITVIEESNHALKDKITSALTKEGFAIATASSSQKILSAPAEFKSQLIILGEGLPIDSFEACSQLRQAVDVPILMVGAVPRDQAWTRVIETGADFYLVKPFGYLELVARVKALLRRYEWSNGKKPGGKE
jgi:two-component system KDP operon response regulator KdpE/two-component system response regulator VicR